MESRSDPQVISSWKPKMDIRSVKSFGSIVFLRFFRQVNRHSFVIELTSYSYHTLLASGLRLGFVSGPSRVVDAIATHTSSANLQTSSTSQAIAFAMLSHFGYEGFEKHTEYVSQYYRQKRDVFEAAMNKHLTGLVEWSAPVSGMFIWYVRLSRPISAKDESYCSGRCTLPG